MFCIGGVNLQTSLQLLPIANDKECKMEQISQNIEKSAPFFVFTPPRFLHPHHPTPLFTRRDMGGYEVNNCKEDTENGASQREKRLCKNSHQSMEQKSAVQQRRAAQHKYSTTSVQRNKGVQLNTSTAQQAYSATKAQRRLPFTQKCSYWFAFYLRKVSSMFSISSRNVASVANCRSIFLQLWRMVEWSRPPSSRPICDNDTSVNF